MGGAILILLIGVVGLLFNGVRCRTLTSADVTNIQSLVTTVRSLLFYFFGLSES
jgi:hypothetical protein